MLVWENCSTRNNTLTEGFLTFLQKGQFYSRTICLDGTDRGQFKKE